MIELSLRVELYPVESVREAVLAFADHATLDVEEHDVDTLVRVTVPEGTDEAMLAAELCNYALGLTIERRRGG